MSYYQTTAMRKSKRVLCTYVAACKQCPHTPCNFAHTIEDLMDSNNDTFKTMPCKNDDRRSNNRCMYSHSCSFGHYDSDGKMREVQFFRNWFGKEPLMCGSCEIFPSLMDDEFPEMVNFLKKKKQEEQDHP